jgi:AbrB family looped-hinge helix DNA binding protein
MPMASAPKLTTTVSTKGQVILPMAIRRQGRWEAGTRLVVEDTAEGVLLRPAPHFPETKPEEVFASLRYFGAGTLKAHPALLTRLLELHADCYASLTFRP